MGTCPLARLSLLSMLHHGFVIEAVHGHESNISWSRRARQEDRRIGGQVPIIWAPVPLLVFRQEDRGTDAHNMGTCPLARLSLLSMLNLGFVIEAVHGHESNITWSPRARQEHRATGAHNMGTCILTRFSPRG